MANIKNEYGSASALTITLASLADAAAREATVVDNSSDKFIDALVAVRVKPQNSGSIIAPSHVLVYAYASVDDGGEYTDAVTGTDAAITPNSPTQLKLLGAVYIAAINVTYRGGPWSVKDAFGGSLPKRWGIVVFNDCGTALSATGSDHAVEWQGVFNSVA